MEPIEIGPSGRPASRFFARARGRAFNTTTAGQTTIIEIFDEIGAFGVDVADVTDQLRNAGDVTVKINSPGGDVFAGIAIYNALLAHAGNIRVEVVGVAASAASIIAMAGDEIAIADNAFLMIHRAWGVTVGNVADHQESADLLDQVDSALASTYAARSGQPLAAVVAAMATETWFGADAALTAGYATQRLTAATTQARFDLSAFQRTPAALSGAPEGDLSIRDIEAALRDAGASKSQARGLAARGYHGIADQRRDAAAMADLAAHIAAIVI